MKLQLKGKIITKSMLREEVYKLLKTERKMELMNMIDTEIFIAKNEEEALNAVSKYMEIV